MKKLIWINLVLIFTTQAYALVETKNLCDNNRTRFNHQAQEEVFEIFNGYAQCSCSDGKFYYVKLTSNQNEISKSVKDSLRRACEGVEKNKSKLNSINYDGQIITGVQSSEGNVVYSGKEDLHGQDEMKKRNFLKEVNYGHQQFFEKEKMIRSEIKSNAFYNDENGKINYQDILNDKEKKKRKDYSIQVEQFKKNSNNLKSEFENQPLIPIKKGNSYERVKLYLCNETKCEVNPNVTISTLYDQKDQETLKAAHEKVKTYNNNSKEIAKLETKNTKIESEALEKKKKDDLNVLSRTYDEIDSIDPSVKREIGEESLKLYVSARDELIEDCKKFQNEEGKQGKYPQDKGIKTEEEIKAALNAKGEQINCVSWAEEQAWHNPEVQEAKALADARRENHDNNFGTPNELKNGASNNSNQSVGKQNKLKIGIEICDKFYAENSPVRNYHKNLTEKQAGAALATQNVAGKEEEIFYSYPDHRRADFIHPNSCANKKSPVFNNLLGMKFFTNFRDDPEENLSEFGTKQLCTALAYRLSDENTQKVNAPNEGMKSCNVYLKSMVTCGGSTSSNKKISFTEQLQFDANNDFKLDPSIFPSPSFCEDYLYNRFRACMGFSYQSKNFDPTIPVNNNQGKDDHSQYPTQNMAANQKQQGAAKEGFIDEWYNLFGTCLAFRDLSREQIEDYGPWEEDEQFHSIDGRLTCFRRAPYTQDYKACRTVVHFYNGAIAGETAVALGGQTWSMIEQKNINEKAMGQMAQGDQVNAALDAQKKMYNHQRQKENMNLGFQSAQVAAFSTMLMSYPTPNKFGKKCSDGSSTTGNAECLASLAAGEDSELRRELFANQNTKKQLWGKVMESSASAILAALKSAQYKKMAANVGKYQDAFNGLNNEATQTSSNFEIGYCKLNPTAPGCTGRGPRIQGSIDQSFGGINMQTGGGQAFDLNANDGSFGEFEDSDNNNVNSNAIADLASVMGNNEAGRFNDDFKKAGAATFSRSPESSGGGGGGGGGGGAMGGGGAPSGRAPANAQEAFGGSKQKVNYAAAGGGKTKFGGAGSAATAKKDGDSNPFSNLLGKANNRNVAATDQNDIAPSHSGLFDKISKRYTEIQQDNRLINLNNIE